MIGIYQHVTYEKLGEINAVDQLLKSKAKDIRAAGELLVK